MKLHLLEGRKPGGYTTFGGVWEKGEVQGDGFRLTDKNGNRIPMQSRVLASWPDGSVKWSSHVADSGTLGAGGELEPEKAGKETEEQELFLKINQCGEGWEVDTGALTLTVLRPGKEGASGCLAENLRIHEGCIAERVYPVFQLERKIIESTEAGAETAAFRECREVTEAEGVLEETVLEQSGPLQAVFCFRGRHMSGEETGMPFVIRMYLWAGSSELKLVHTFLYDGKEDRDYLKGMGIRFDTVLAGAPVNHHIQYTLENRVFHEAAVMLYSSHPKLAPEIFRGQMEGKRIDLREEGDVSMAAAALPIWNRYRLIQDSSYHFGVRKQTRSQCCELKCKEGEKSLGIMSVSGEQGSLTVGVRDFWQKYPGELEVTGLGESRGTATVWFYSPGAEAYDFRHYDTRSYPATCYEGFAWVGASAYGIGVTSECTVRLEGRILTEQELLNFGQRVQKPAVYVGTPEYYHKKRAFGYWSLPDYSGEQARRLEEELGKAIDFYKREVENRDWYGLFDYGDIMHSYDQVRHTWKYDVGGFAWQNTELVDTYWLWLYFLRTGREDVFTLAEAMSRHCSEVDTYHFGPLQGLGSRHNVRHWGCSCKEPRIGMAGHHRFLYYLTGDDRLGDVMEDVKDADLLKAKDCNGGAGLSEERKLPEVRSGPDWSSYVSNWMTHYERTLEKKYRDRIETGIRDIAAAPYGLASGPDYQYDIENAHLVYVGEREDTPNQHLQICMGGPQIWLETSDMLEDDTLKELLADLGEFYYLSPEEKSRLTEGKIQKRPFSWPFMATGVSAFAAYWRNDRALAGQTWDILLGELEKNAGQEGFTPEYYGVGTARDDCQEVPWITTNVVSQWCLNVIMALEFIGKYLKDSWKVSDKTE